MRVDEALILERTDLLVESNKKVIEDITHRDFELSTIKLTSKFHVVLFVDENGRTKIIKNRFGDESERFNFNQLLDKYELVNNRYIEAERFLVSLIKINWWKRLFIKRKIIQYIKSTVKKYDF